MTKDELYEKIRNKALDRVNQELSEAIRYAKSNRIIAYVAREAMPAIAMPMRNGLAAVAFVAGVQQVQQYAHGALLEEYIDEEIRQQAESVALFDEIGKMLKDIRKEREG